MRLSISNIAWEPAEDAAVADVLRDHGVDRIDIAPGKYFPDPTRATDGQVAAVRGAWADRGIALHGMQSLLFGTQGLNLFGDDGRMLDRLARICDLAGRLGIGALTFGSPRNRDRGDLAEEAARAEAAVFFRRLGDAARDAGTIVCLEPNPAIYDCNFMVTTAETAAVVAQVDHPAIRLQLDVGALGANGEDPEAEIAAHAAIIGHVHASEPRLVAMGEAGAPHEAAAAALRRHRPQSVVAIEMAAGQGPQVERIRRSVALIASVYGERAC